MNPLTSDLAQAHICELRRSARRTRRFGANRQSWRARRATYANDRAFSHHFVPVTAGLFRHF